MQTDLAKFPTCSDVLCVRRTTEDVVRKLLKTSTCSVCCLSLDHKLIFPGPLDIHLMPLHVMILLSLHLYLLVTKHWTYKVPSSRVVHPPQNMACKYFNSSNDSRSFSTRSQAHSKYRSPWEWDYLKVFLFSPFAGRTEERTLRNQYYCMYDTPT